MEVWGNKLFSELDSLTCKPCEGRDCYARADGLCGDCEEYMCNTCFDTHKQSKVCRCHTLTRSGEKAVKKEQTVDLDICGQHFKRVIKLYCIQHEEVGCRDCMILEHKTCKVEYISDKACNFRYSKEFKDLVKGADDCRLVAKEILSSIKNNKAQIIEVNEKFNDDVNIFKEEMIAHITELTNAMLKLGEKIKAIDIKTLELVEKENEKMMGEISKITTEIESKIDKPKKLFINAVLQKPKLEKLRNQLERIKNRSKIEMFEFKRDENVNRSVKGCKQLGLLQRIKQIKETELHEEEVRPKKPIQMIQAYVPPKAQPLLDTQLIGRNITVDGEYLSYVDDGDNDVGLYVDKKKIADRRYFVMEIINMGQPGTITIEMVDVNQRWVLRFQTCDGKLYSGNVCKDTGYICSVGDRIGCALKYCDWREYTIVFTRNGKMIGETFIWDSSCHAAVRMLSAGEKVRLILDAKMPNV